MRFDILTIILAIGIGIARMTLILMDLFGTHVVATKLRSVCIIFYLKIHNFSHRNAIFRFFLAIFGNIYFLYIEVNPNLIWAEFLVKFGKTQTLQLYSLTCGIGGLDLTSILIFSK